MSRRAYTLVEVLAVTVLLGLLASLGVPPLLRSITGDPLAQAAGRLVLAFRDTRAQAFGHHLRLDLETWGFTASTMADGVETSLPTTRLPEAVEVTWIRSERPIRLLELDPRGHGLDTRVIMRVGDRALAFTIDGLTGTWVPQAAP